MKILRAILAIALVGTIVFAFLVPLISSTMQDYWKSKMGDVTGEENGTEKAREFLAKKNFWVRFSQENDLLNLAFIFFILLIIVCFVIWVKRFF